MSKRRTINHLFWIILVTGTIFVLGCGAKGIKPVSPMDTPEHHNLIGMKSFEKGEFQEALREFERARDLDPKYAPAYVGIGLTTAELNKFDDAFSAMKKAKRLASSKPDKILVYSGMIRLYTKWKGKGWLEKAEENFSNAKLVDKADPAPYYYMAVAYRTAQEYKKAAENFKKVISLKKGYVEQADMGWEAVQKVERAQPGTEVGEKIAGLDRITRADVAALFVEELKLEALFREKGIKIEENVPSRPGDRPTDYDNHVLRNDIDTVLRLGIRGLELFEEGVFQPEKEINRANFAMMIEDILVRISREEYLPSKHINCESPFKDVKSSYYAFNAIVTCTTRGIMDADLQGYFRKDEPVTGADALLILRRLKGKIK